MSRAKRILVVDDLDHNRILLGGLVETLGYEVETARDGLEALAKLPLDVDLILLDVMMPGIDGYEVTRRVRADPIFCDLPIIVVTALDNREDRVRAVQAGANDFIAKPIDKTELLVRLSSQLKLKEAQDALKRSQTELENKVTQRTEALRQALQTMADAQRSIYDAHLDTIERLVLAAEYKDHDTAVHIRRMSGYGVILAQALRLPPGEVEILRHAIPMHDVGKIGIPDAILLKPGKLTREEREIMCSHTVIGARILAGSPSRLLQAGEIIALSHHEHWDGQGYPQGVAGESIPLWGRICALADVFDALTSDRPYRAALSTEETLELMWKGRGSQFDPALFDLLIAQLDAILEVQKDFRESLAPGLAEVRPQLAND
ncbi:MAG TPA: HD domain-containing phosphohydrolase [Thermoanaerobaculia bacterium]|nr:HD domain-containing phosphohydrolase [Thermoanaerobaculia bacterium]